MDLSYIKTLNEQFKDINFLYSALDEKEGIDYAEQYIGIHPLSKNKYVISMAIADVTVLFDPTLNFIDNVSHICTRGAKRGKHCLGHTGRDSRKNHFLKAFGGGMRDAVDHLNIKYNQQLPFLCFDTLVDLKKDDRTILERVTPLTVTQRPVDTSRRFTFKNFMDPDKAAINKTEETLREDARKFVGKIEQFPHLPQVSFCMGSEKKGDRRPFGDKVNTAVSLVVKIAGAKASLGYGIPLITKDSNADYVVLGDKEAHVDYDCTDLTAPLRHPAAAYNIHQFKKIYKISTNETATNQQCEGNRQAERVCDFFNKQAKNYRIPSFSDSNHRFLRGTSLISPPSPSS